MTTLTSGNRLPLTCWHTTQQTAEAHACDPSCHLRGKQGHTKGPQRRKATCLTVEVTMPLPALIVPITTDNKCLLYV